MFVINRVNGSQSLSACAQNPINLGQSQAYITSTFREYDAQGNLISKEKATDDKITLGYTGDGLPFQVVADGFFGCEKELVFQFIDAQILPLIDPFAERLSQGDEPYSVILELVDLIRQQREDLWRDCNLEFTLSLAITYEYQGKLFVVGFGIGDTGLVLRSKSQGIIQLAHNNQVNFSKDAFCDVQSLSALNSKDLLERNSFFHQEVFPQDELFGYTALLGTMEEKSAPYLIEPSYQFIAMKTLPEEDELEENTFYLSPEPQNPRVVAYTCKDPNGMVVPSSILRHLVKGLQGKDALTLENIEQALANKETKESLLSLTAKRGHTKGRAEICKKALHTSPELGAEELLIRVATKELEENLSALEQKAKVAKEPQRFGDDTAFGSILIPDEKLRERMKNAALIQLEIALEKAGETDLSQAAKALVSVIQEAKVAENADGSSTEPRVLLELASLTYALLNSEAGRQREDLLHELKTQANSFMQTKLAQEEPKPLPKDDEEEGKSEPEPVAQSRVWQTLTWLGLFAANSSPAPQAVPKKSIAKTILIETPLSLAINHLVEEIEKQKNTDSLLPLASEPSHEAESRGPGF